MATFLPKPIFLSYDDFNTIGYSEFKKDVLAATPKQIRNTLINLNDPQPYVVDDYKVAIRFLIAKGRKTEATYRLFRSDTERFLLWAWYVEKKSISMLKRRDIESYIDFVRKPPKNWISTGIVSRFNTDIIYDEHSGKLTRFYLEYHNQWRPFSIRVAKDEPRKDELIANYQSNSTFLKATMGVLNAFYEFLVDEDYAFGNVIPAVRKDCPYIIKDVSISEVNRFNDLQWEYLLSTCKKLADKDSINERMLFLVVTMRALYLRISELSERDYHSPQMNHFFKDGKGNVWLRIMGKGKKIRDVTVPDDYMPYLSRYRNHLGLSEFPAKDDTSPILSKIKGSGSLKPRQLRLIVQNAFDATYLEMIEDGFTEDAQIFKEATSHYLRHTGASMDAPMRPLKHMSDDLGHADMQTTDRLYIHSDDAERARSGRSRSV